MFNLLSLLIFPFPLVYCFINEKQKVKALFAFVTLLFDSQRVSLQRRRSLRSYIND